MGISATLPRYGLHNWCRCVSTLRRNFGSRRQSPRLSLPEHMPRPRPCCLAAPALAGFSRDAIVEGCPFLRSWLNAEKEVFTGPVARASRIQQGMLQGQVLRTGLLSRVKLHLGECSVCFVFDKSHWPPPELRPFASYEHVHHHGAGVLHA